MTIKNTGRQLSSDTSFYRVKIFNDVRARYYVEIFLRKTCHAVRIKNGGVIMHHFEIRRIEDPEFKKLMLF